MKAIFNVRVYGILIENEQVLITDEMRYNTYITKFPGGGLQFGEGTAACIKREFREELDIDIEIKSHFYTVDFFQSSAFDSKQQIISIYYLVASKLTNKINTIDTRLKKEEVSEGYQAFRWRDLKNITANEFTFPIDRKVAELLNIMGNTTAQN